MTENLDNAKDGGIAETVVARRSSHCYRVSLRRLFWKCAYPFCRIGHKLFGLSYKWVNVGIAAWHGEYFDALWHWRWFGDSIDQMPDEVNLCGIVYRTTVAEGLVQFSESHCSGTRLCFERDPHDQYGFLWYYEGSQRVPACHWEEAYAWVKAVYGGSHELKRPALSR